MVSRLSLEEVVQKKYRITIPVELREKLRIKEGDRVRIFLDDGRLIVQPHWFVKKPTERLSSLGTPRTIVTKPEELEEKIRKGRLR